MTNICGLCDKELAKAGEPHECRSFSEAFWSDFRPVYWINCGSCGRLFNGDTELEHDCEDGLA